MVWLDQSSATATTEGFNEQKENLVEIVNPITSELYNNGGSGPSAHDEL